MLQLLATTHPRHRSSELAHYARKQLTALSLQALWLDPKWVFAFGLYEEADNEMYLESFERAISSCNLDTNILALLCCNNQVLFCYVFSKFRVDTSLTPSGDLVAFSWLKLYSISATGSGPGAACWSAAAWCEEFAWLDLSSSAIRSGRRSIPFPCEFPLALLRLTHRCYRS